MLGGVAGFYLNAVTTALLSWIVLPENEVTILTRTNDINRSGPPRWAVCRKEFPNNSTFCDTFDSKMNLAVSRISQGLGAMKLSTIRLQEYNSVSGFTPPDPSESTQDQINELKKDIIDLQDKIAGMDPTNDLDQLRAAMAAMQEDIAGLNTAMDNVVKQAIDALQPQIDQLISSLDTLAANVYSLKLAVANVESALEQTQIVDIVSGILYGSVNDAVFRYQHGVFKKGNASTVMSTIVTLGYPEVLKNMNHFVNFLGFLSQLDDDQQKLWGYEGLYYAVLANGQLYDTPQPFILAYKFSKLCQTSTDGDVILQAVYFLSKVIHPVISNVVFQPTKPLTTQRGSGQVDCVDGALQIKLGNSYPYDFVDTDARSVELGCALATIPNDSVFVNMCLLLLRGNSLSTKSSFSDHPITDWNDPNMAYSLTNATCDFYDCTQSSPSFETGAFSIFGRNMGCQDS